MDIIGNIGTVIGLIISCITLYTLASGKLSNKLTDKIEKTIKPHIDEIKDINTEQSKNINQVKIDFNELKEQYLILQTATQDMMRQRIMSIYNKNKTMATLTDYDREVLDKLYDDYKKIGGNSYIDKFYSIMKKWEVIANHNFNENDEELF